MPVGPTYVGSSELPWPEGEHPGADVRSDDVDPLTGRRARWTLSGMANDHRFFSAVVVNHLGLSFDPVALYWAENALPPRESPLWLDLGRVVLKGLPPPLDRVVFACPAAHAPGLFTFLDRFSARRPDGVWDAVHQRLELVDWALVDSLTVVPPKPPTVPLELYGVAGPAGGFAWTPPEDPWKTPLRLTFHPKLRPPSPKPSSTNTPSWR